MTSDVNQITPAARSACIGFAACLQQCGAGRVAAPCEEMRPRWSPTLVPRAAQATSDASSQQSQRNARQIQGVCKDFLSGSSLVGACQPARSLSAAASLAYRIRQTRQIRQIRQILRRRSSPLSPMTRQAALSPDRFLVDLTTASWSSR